MKLLALAIAVAACLGLAGCDELLRPGFPHRAHLTEDRCGGDGEVPCPTCVSCHEAMRGEEPARPDVAVCRSCHGAEAPAAMAAVRSGSQKRTDILFSHARHLSRGDTKGQCVGCHAGIADDGVRGDVFPEMKTCLGCHDDGLQADSCNGCHRARDLVSLVPETFLRHDQRFFRSHGVAATRHQGVCNQCHAESACLACHDQGVPISAAEMAPDEPERPLIHRGDFVVRHAIESRSSPGECTSCHAPSFCDSCHLERGISGNRAGALNPHPIGWIGPDVDGPDFHGRAARRDILPCAGCHEAGPATNCIRCHKVGGPGGNPHPNGWTSLRSPNSQMCNYCHGG